MVFPTPPSVNTPIPNEPFFYPEEKDEVLSPGPHVAWVTPTKAVVKDIAKAELIAHKDVVCHINQAPARDLTDAELSSPAWQPNTQYEIGDVVSLASGDGLAPGYHHFALSREGDQYYAHLDGEFLSNATATRPFTMGSYSVSGGAPFDTTSFPTTINASDPAWINRVEGTETWTKDGQTPEELGITWDIVVNELGSISLEFSEPVNGMIDFRFSYPVSDINVFKLLGTRVDEGYDNETRFSGVHLVKGQSLYTDSNFTPPVGLIQPNNNSVLLLNVASEGSKLVDATGRHTVKVLATDARGQELSEVDPEIVSDSGRNYLVLPASTPTRRQGQSADNFIVNDPGNIQVPISLRDSVAGSVKLYKVDQAVVIPPSLYDLTNPELTFAKANPGSRLTVNQTNGQYTLNGGFVIELWLAVPQEAFAEDIFSFNGPTVANYFSLRVTRQSDEILLNIFFSGNNNYFSIPIETKDFSIQQTHIAIARSTNSASTGVWIDGQYQGPFTHGYDVYGSNATGLTIGVGSLSNPSGWVLRDFSVKKGEPELPFGDDFVPSLVVSPEGKDLLLFSDPSDLLADVSVNQLNTTFSGSVEPFLISADATSLSFGPDLSDEWWPTGSEDIQFGLTWEKESAGDGPAYGANYDVRLTTEDPSEDFSLFGDFTFEMYFYAGELGAPLDSAAQLFFGNLLTESSSNEFGVAPQSFEWSEYRSSGALFYTEWSEASNIAISIDGEPLAGNAYSITQGVNEVSIVFAEPIPADTYFAFTLSYDYSYSNDNGFISLPSGNVYDAGASQLMELDWPARTVPSYNSDLWIAYKPCVFEVAADREINWSQAVQDGRVQINDNFFAVYFGRVKLYSASAEYRFGDLAIEPHPDWEVLGAPSPTGVYKVWLRKDGQWQDDDANQRSVAFQWNEVENKVTVYQRNPEQEYESWTIDDSRSNYILKEVDGHLTLWASAWFNQVGGLSGSVLQNEDFAGYNSYQFDGNMHWLNLYDRSALGGQNFSLPFDGAIADGARLNFPITYDMHQFRNNRVYRLGMGTWRNESSIYPRGGPHGATEQGIQVYWHRYMGIWTHENT